MSNEIKRLSLRIPKSVHQDLEIEKIRSEEYDTFQDLFADMAIAFTNSPQEFTKFLQNHREVSTND